MSAASRRSGSTAVQFDLRFYVVALVFIIFEVEVALFFPPATIFGKATQLMSPQSPRSRRKLQRQLGDAASDSRPSLGKRRNAARASIAESARAGPTDGYAAAGRRSAADARLLALAAMVDLGAVLRRDPAGLRLCLAAGRSRLGPGGRRSAAAGGIQCQL